MYHKRKYNNGFSLIELIAAISIMAVMIAILSPAFMKFIEKARQTTDLQNANELAQVLQVIATDDDLAGDDYQYAYLAILPKGAESTYVAGSDSGTLRLDEKYAEHGIDLDRMAIRSKQSELQNGYVILFDHAKETITLKSITNPTSYSAINAGFVLSSSSLKEFSLDATQ